jgi:CspA family cold shock protein
MADTQRLTGMVKWFNNKAGFGFITVSEGQEQSGKDIFAHYSSIRVTNSQYKYLVQGEYVDFVLTRSENEKHEFHAADITGVRNGPILCETRQVAHDAQPQRPTYKYRNGGGRRENNERPASPTEPPLDASENA